ncbi:hypothetical protein R4144_04655, partial [Gordonia amicalis]|nr:hypothetical protein [Gordonia amicalis]
MDSAGRAHVLITFGRSFLSLELARLMAAGGHRVTTVDSVAVAISRFSNGVSDFHRVPPPKFEPLAYCRALARIVEENDVDMVIPVHEETDIIAMLADLADSTGRRNTMIMEVFAVATADWSWK